VRPSIARLRGRSLPASSAQPGGPVYRTRCCDIWFDIDGNGAATTSSVATAYRWLYSALHTLDVPILMAHP
jgi:hypothetical protein